MVPRLKEAGDIGTCYIDKKAAEVNEHIGNLNKGNFSYSVKPTLKEALVNADFVVISILPGTFDEIKSDVHTPECLEIYQSVGDTIEPGGHIRALRTVIRCFIYI